MMKKRRYGTYHVLIWFCLCYSVCCTSFASPTNSKEKLRILFVGNSLTYTNDLPQLVKNAAKAKGIKVSVEMIAFPNYALIDHWADGVVQRKLEAKKYDYVIFQQGPSSQSEGKGLLLDYGKKYSELSVQNGSHPCFFMVWPSRQYYHTFDGVIANYTEVAKVNDATLIPVGTIWKQYFDLTENYDYYGFDGFHPSLKGSEKAAEVIVQTLILKKISNK